MKDYEEKLEELGYQFDEEGNYWYRKEYEYMLRIEVNGQYGHINYGIYASNDFLRPTLNTRFSSIWNSLKNDVNKIEEVIKN